MIAFRVSLSGRELKLVAPPALACYSLFPFRGIRPLLMRDLLVVSATFFLTKRNQQQQHEKRLRVRNDEWEPDAATLTMLGEMGAPLSFFMETRKEETRTMEERQARRYGCTYTEVPRELYTMDRLGASFNRISLCREAPYDGNSVLHGVSLIHLRICIQVPVPGCESNSRRSRQPSRDHTLWSASVRCRIVQTYNHKCPISSTPRHILAMVLQTALLVSFAVKDLLDQ